MRELGFLYTQAGHLPCGTHGVSSTGPTRLPSRPGPSLLPNLQLLCHCLQTFPSALWPWGRVGPS